MVFPADSVHSCFVQRVYEIRQTLGDADQNEI